MILRCLLLLCACCVVTGCDNISNLMRDDAVLVLRPPVDSDPEQVLRMLQGRFEAFRPSAYSSVEAKVEDGLMHFVFHRGAPETPILGTLVMQRGVLTATLETGEPLYGSSDIIEANTVFENGGVYLKLVVTDEAAQRIEEVTTRNVGKVINVVLDGFNVFRSTISEPFSKRFQLSADYPFNEVRVIEALVEHGPLPGAVGFVSATGLFEQAAKVDASPQAQEQSP